MNNNDNNNLRQFRQKPIWNLEEKFEINGEELKAIETVSEAFTKFIPVLENVFIRNLMNGKITIKYEDIDGNEISKEEILKMYETFINNKPHSVDTEPNIY